MKQKIMIATPTHNGSIDVLTYMSVFAAVDALQKRGIEVAIRTKVATLVDRARNLFASVTLNDHSVTHLLFVDADMGFPATAVLRMLEFDKPVLGVLYPTRGTPSRFVCAETIVPGRKPRDGFIRTLHVGTGLMLIKRHVLEEMRDHYGDLYFADGDPSYRQEGLEGPLLEVFSQMRDRHGRMMGEDTSFCQRWVDMGARCLRLPTRRFPMSVGACGKAATATSR